MRHGTPPKDSAIGCSNRTSALRGRLPLPLWAAFLPFDAFFWRPDTLPFLE